jgi:hypothetical protein
MSLRSRLELFMKSLGVYHAYRRRRANADVRTWNARGRPSPPPHAIKVAAVHELARTHGIRCLVETGTYLGDMIHASKDRFDEIVSIEIQPQLAAMARKRFRRDAHVRVECGDSGEVLRSIVPSLDKAAVFWLDGHYSGGVTGRGGVDTPVIAELEVVLADHRFPHVVIIDDAREFVGANGYPTIEELTQLVKSRRGDLSVSVVHDGIRLVPRAT